MDRNELIKTGLLLYLCENSKIRLEKNDPSFNTPTEFMLV